MVEARCPLDLKAIQESDPKLGAWVLRQKK
jgi:hypothetical protein